MAVASFGKVAAFGWFFGVALTSVGATLESRIAQITEWLPTSPVADGARLSDRTAWGRLADSPGGAAVVAQAEAILSEPIPDCGDELYMAYFERGELEQYRSNVYARLSNLQRLYTAECLENAGRFLPKIEDYVAAILALRCWTLPSHDEGLVAFNGSPHVDLLGGDIAYDLAVCRDWLGDRLSATARDGIVQKVNDRVFTPYLDHVRGKREVFYQWWTVESNNWNSVCHCNVTRAALALCADRQLRAEFVARTEDEVRHALDGYMDDGYCTEGIGYWNYGFGHYIELGLSLRAATGGRVDILAGEKCRKIMAYAYGFQICDGQSPQFADGAGNPDATILALGRQIWPDLVNSRALSAPLLPDDVRVFSLRAFGQEPEPVPPTMDVLPSSSWFGQAQVAISRVASADGVGDWGIGLKGGNNDELHNHNDTGSYTLILDGCEMGGDPGGVIYDAETFSDDRYEAEMLNSHGHPVPVVGGCLQEQGAEFAASVVRAQFGADRDEVTLECKGAYKVAALRSLVRTLTTDRTTGEITISDHVTFSSPTAFEVPMITYRKFASTDGGQTFVFNNLNRGRRMRMKVTASAPIRYSLTLVENPGKRSPSRLAFAFESPVTEATLTMTFSPLAAGGKDEVREEVTAEGRVFVHKFADTSRDHFFTNNTGRPLQVRYLAVGGGAAGGDAFETDLGGAGGGGGGGVAGGTAVIPVGGIWRILVGKGGASPADPYSDRLAATASEIHEGDQVVVQAPGGGAGGCVPWGSDSKPTRLGQAGAAGGGASGNYTSSGAGAGTFASCEDGLTYGPFAGGGSPWFYYQWANGGATKAGCLLLGGGGGGAGGAGEGGVGANCTDTDIRSGNGGIGVVSDITGERVCYGGGGGGGGGYSATVKYYANLSGKSFAAGGGGVGGGGNGASWDGTSFVNAADGENELGGGGGGGAGCGVGNARYGGDGGSGVVILRYAMGANGDSGDRVFTVNRPYGTERVHVFSRTDGPHWFKNETGKNLTVRYLVVGGGGAGGDAYACEMGPAGGGGGGGVAGATVTMRAGETWTINVGKGGIAPGDRYAMRTPAGSSSISNGTVEVVLAPGGGAGGCAPGNGSDCRNGTAGAAGGGASGNAALGGSASSSGAGTFASYEAGTTYSANRGGNTTWFYYQNRSSPPGCNQLAGGGGGAGGAGGTANGAAKSGDPASGAGGIGVASDITGELKYYGGGGGGGGAPCNSKYTRYKFLEGLGWTNGILPGAGGEGGGGDGARWTGGNTINITNAEDGEDGTGGGGGGSATATDRSTASWFGWLNSSEKGGNGGSGIVVLRCRVVKSGLVLLVR